MNKGFQYSVVDFSKALESSFIKADPQADSRYAPKLLTNNNESGSRICNAATYRVEFLLPRISTSTTPTHFESCWNTPTFRRASSKATSMQRVTTLTGTVFRL